MKSPSLRGRGFEVLESRHMLAGNVKVEYSGDTLTFTGDGSNNNIFIERRNSSQIRVYGRQYGDTSLNTKINGSLSSKTFSFSETKNSLDIGMNAGDDYVRLDTYTNVRLRTKYLDVRMGSGADKLYVFRTYVYYSTNVTTDTENFPQGSDTLKLLDVQLGTEISYGSYSHSYGTTSIKTGGGSDNVILDDVFALHNVTIDTARAGVDSSADKVTLIDVRCAYDDYHHDQGTLKITTGAGKDTINLTRVKSDFIEVYAKGGDDTVSFISVLFDNDGSRVDGGSGVDKLTRRSNGGDGLGDVYWASFEYKYS